LKKGHRSFVTIITGISNGNLLILGILTGKKKQTVKDFLAEIPLRIRKTVETVCVDLYEGFINAAKEIFPKKTQITADRFHVAKLYRYAFETLRKKEMKRLKLSLPKKEYSSFKGVMWVLRKDENTLSLEENDQLAQLFKQSTPLKKAYQLRNELTDLFNIHKNQFQGKHRINYWIRKVKRSSVRCFDTFIKTLLKFKDEITHYFTNRNNSGFVEGLNNKIKVIKRRCYGILNKFHLFQRIYLDISGYARFL